MARKEPGKGEGGAMTPEEAARAVQPRTARTGRDGGDPREEMGRDQPESSAQKQPEPPEELT